MIVTIRFRLVSEIGAVNFIETKLQSVKAELDAQKQVWANPACEGIETVAIGGQVYELWNDVHHGSNCWQWCAGQVDVKRTKHLSEAIKSALRNIGNLSNGRIFKGLS